MIIAADRITGFSRYFYKQSICHNILNKFLKTP